MVDWCWNAWAWLSSYDDGILTSLVSSLIWIMLGAYYRTIFFFFKRIFWRSNNDYITGCWKIYRYKLNSENGEYLFFHDEWIIKRGFTKEYAIKVKRARRLPRINRMNYRCKHVLLEDHKFNVIIEGVDHYQQSMISFRPVEIRPTSMLGLGVGVDSRGDTCARVYFACQAEISDDIAKEIVVDATRAFAQTSWPLLYLPLDSQKRFGNDWPKID